jgi:AbrB family looped-hinge helix DNA binding protein
MKTATISPKGWVVIPAEMRERYGMRPGTKVAILDNGNGITLVPLSDDPIETLSGMFAGEPLTEMLIAEHQAAYDTENKRFGEKA